VDRRRALTVMAGGLLAPACATLGSLGQLVRPLRIEDAPDREAELRLGGGRGGASLGSASLRLWALVSNPNPFGLTLAALAGTLFLEDARAATADFPLGLPLRANGEEIVPLDLTIDFSDLVGLRDAAGLALRGEPLAYRLDGRVTLDAGTLGTPSFGPSTLLRGEVRPLGGRSW
jgi:hypothetical protein